MTEISLSTRKSPQLQRPLTECCCAAASSVRITTNITSFSNNSPVNVTFSGVTSPTDQDVVGLFFQNASADDVLPLKYKWARTSPGYTTTGSGSLSFVLSNQRQNVVFQFFRQDRSMLSALQQATALKQQLTVMCLTGM